MPVIIELSIGLLIISLAASIFYMLYRAIKDNGKDNK